MWVLYILGSALVTALLDLGGVAGYRTGFLIVAALLAATYALPLRLIGGDRVARAWLLVATVIAVVMAGLLVDRAPYSSPRLAGEMNALRVPQFEVVEESHRGNGRCRPSCPTVTRVYEAPFVTKRALVVQIATALQQRGFELDLAETYARASAFEANSERVQARVSTPTSNDDRRQVVITFNARKGRGSSSVSRQ